MTDAGRDAQIPDNLTFEQVASVPLGLATAVCPIWTHHPEASTVNFPAPWEEGGATKYAGKPAFIIGGSTSVGQFGEPHDLRVCYAVCNSPHRVCT